MYNTSGYESLEALGLLDGIVDIYMPDMRYSDDAAGVRYSVAPHYPEINRAAVKEMYRQVGNLVIGEDGMAKRGLLVRHLVLPGGLSGTEERHEVPGRRDLEGRLRQPHVPVLPGIQGERIKEISRRITEEEYDEACRIREKYGLENGWVQEFE